MTRFSPPQIGSRVHGAIAAIEHGGLVVDFQAYRGFIPAAETGVATAGDLRRHFAVLDEIEAWVVSLDRERIGLTLLAQSASPAQAEGVKSPPPSKPLPGVRPGEGVPFWELYMRRRSTRSWSNRQY